jgi:hypothetical protein
MAYWLLAFGLAAGLIAPIMSAGNGVVVERNALVAKGRVLSKGETVSNKKALPGPGGIGGSPTPRLSIDEGKDVTEAGREAAVAAGGAVGV